MLIKLPYLPTRTAFPWSVYQKCLEYQQVTEKNHAFSLFIKRKLILFQKESQNNWNRIYGPETDICRCFKLLKWTILWVHWKLLLGAQPFNNGTKLLNCASISIFLKLWLVLGLSIYRFFVFQLERLLITRKLYIWHFGFVIPLRGSIGGTPIE